MKFTELDKRMRRYETEHDHCVLPGIRMVARLDGRGFTGLVRNRLGISEAYSPGIRSAMRVTTRHLMRCGFNVDYGYTQSDEISLLFAANEDTFSRKVRKFNSVLAGEASAAFSLYTGEHGAFDCRVIELPLVQDVVDYFRWRQEDCYRNALNAHIYWSLRAQGDNARAATSKMNGLSNAQKHDMLNDMGIVFAGLPAWQRSGTGMYWRHVVKEGVDPRDGSVMQSERRELYVENRLPVRDEYSKWIRGVVGTD